MRLSAIFYLRFSDDIRGFAVDAMQLLVVVMLSLALLVLIHRWGNRSKFCFLFWIFNRFIVRSIHSEGLLGKTASSKCLTNFSALVMVFGVLLILGGVIMASLMIAKVFVDPVSDTNFPGDTAKFVQFGYSCLTIAFAVVFFVYCILAFLAARHAGKGSMAARSLLFMFFLSLIMMAALVAQVGMDMYNAFNFGSFVLDDRFFAQLIPGCE